MRREPPRDFSRCLEKVLYLSGRVTRPAENLPANLSSQNVAPQDRTFPYSLSPIPYSLPHTLYPLDQSSQRFQQELLVKITFGEIGIGTSLKTAIAIG